MTMKCKVCGHPKKLDIEREIIRGVPHTKIAKKFGVSNMSVRNQAASHLSRQLCQAWAKKGAIETMGLLADIGGIVNKARLARAWSTATCW